MGIKCPGKPSHSARGADTFNNTVTHGAYHSPIKARSFSKSAPILFSFCDFVVWLHVTVRYIYIYI